MDLCDYRYRHNRVVRQIVKVFDQVVNASGGRHRCHLGSGTG
jgi:hypothetical protein